MKTELDFSRVPLDKWVDLYNAVHTMSAMLVDKAYLDIEKAARIEVKDEFDYNKEIADAVTAWWASPKAEPAIWARLQDAVDARKKLLGIVDATVEAEPKRENALAPVEDIIK
jgi:hypothetical protein